MRGGVCVSESVVIIHKQRVVPSLLIRPARRQGKGSNGGNGKHKNALA